MKSKITVYILHGWTYDVSKWTVITDHLNKKYKVHLLKIPGLTDHLHEVWDLEDYVEWLDSQIKDTKSVILLGHSNGGRISLAYTLKYPKKVTKLILIASAGIRDKSIKANAKRFVFGALAKTKKVFFNSEYARKMLYTLAREKDYLNANPIMRQTMNNLIQIDLEDSLATISCPTLLIWGARDTQTPLTDGKKMKQYIPNSHLKVITDARHAPMFTHSEQVLSYIKKFIES